MWQLTAVDFAWLLKISLLVSKVIEIYIHIYDFLLILSLMFTFNFGYKRHKLKYG